mgnify:CR=1 FL=1
MLILPLHKGDLGDYARYSMCAIVAFVPLIAYGRRYPLLAVGALVGAASLQGAFLIRWLEHLWVG